MAIDLPWPWCHFRSIVIKLGPGFSNHLCSEGVSLNIDCAQHPAKPLQLLTQMVWVPDIDVGLLLGANLLET